MTSHKPTEIDFLDSYDYDLPDELIAKVPPENRDDARLLVIDRVSREIRHQSIRDLPTLLNPGDSLVLNNTRVIPARLLGVREATGGKWEGLFLSTNDAGDWRFLSQTRGRLKVGEAIRVIPAHHPNSDECLWLHLKEKQPDGVWLAEPSIKSEPYSILERFGTVPLPPYLRRKLATAADWNRYQTVFAENPGAVAAPTAGLHLTSQLLSQCEKLSIPQTFVTLHVGIGTFRPISAENLAEHAMHSEWCELSTQAAEHLNDTRKRGGRVIAVGTTTVRTLETACRGGEICPWRGETSLFIRPPYQFRAVDCLLTNFHLPKSTLLVLVSAFAGIDLVREAYEAAIAARYRFFSYGDAMLIL